MTQRFDVVSILDLKPRVLIETNFGDITLELEGEAAPLHTANLLQYVDEAFYDGLLFHRNACTLDTASGECDPFVLQGGGFERVDGELERREATQDPVPSEADNGLSNAEVYSVALALSGGDPQSGTTEFFINLGDNSFLDDTDFTVFASVVDGTDVVDAIVATERTTSPLPPQEESLPVEDVVIERMIRVGS
ncbi:MAG: peptidylprolyl isomerase [Planctomycetes bacterium]|nr:peptidylprolyl isomerase [Planctomycetota bacterium]